MLNRHTSLILLAALVAAGALFLPAEPATGEGTETAAGEELFVATHKCNMCHSVEAAGIEAKTKSKAMLGGDLSGGVEGEFEDIVLGALASVEAAFDVVADREGTSR